MTRNSGATSKRVVLFLALALMLACGAPSSLKAKTPTPDESTPVAIPKPTAEAVAYHRTGNWIWAFARVWDLAIPAIILVSGFSGRMSQFANRIARFRFFSIPIYIACYLLIIFLTDLPLRYFAGFMRSHAYGLSNQTLAKWFSDSLKDLGVDVLGAACFAWIPFWIIARWPKYWWLILSALMVPWLAFMVAIAPVARDPLFNDFTPIADKALEAKIIELAGRSGIDGARVFQVNKSVDTKTANAYVTGLGGSKRIVLWDTLLKNFDEREVLAVMAHEMGHYVLNHVGWSISLSSLILLAGFYWADRAGRWLIGRHSGRFGFDSLSNVAATPLILILLGISSTVLAPVALAYSRHNEHEADRFSLELTHLNNSAARAFADLQRENLGIPDHSLVDTLWRSTHPSMGERITFCNTYHPWREGRSLWYGDMFQKDPPPR